MHTQEFIHGGNATHLLQVCLKVFAVHNGGARLNILLLADHISWEVDSEAGRGPHSHPEL